MAHKPFLLISFAVASLILAACSSSGDSNTENATPNSDLANPTKQPPIEQTKPSPYSIIVDFPSPSHSVGSATAFPMYGHITSTDGSPVNLEDIASLTIADQPATLSLNEDGNIEWTLAKVPLTTDANQAGLTIELTESGSEEVHSSTYSVDKSAVFSVPSIIARNSPSDAIIGYDPSSHLLLRYSLTETDQPPTIIGRLFENTADISALSFSADHSELFALDVHSQHLHQIDLTNQKISKSHDLSLVRKDTGFIIDFFITPEKITLASTNSTNNSFHAKFSQFSSVDFSNPPKNQILVDIDKAIIKPFNWITKLKLSRDEKNLLLTAEATEGKQRYSMQVDISTKTIKKISNTSGFTTSQDSTFLLSHDNGITSIVNIHSSGDLTTMALPEPIQTHDFYDIILLENSNQLILTDSTTSQLIKLDVNTQQFSRHSLEEKTGTQVEEILFDETNNKWFSIGVNQNRFHILNADTKTGKLTSLFKTEQNNYLKNSIFNTLDESILYRSKENYLERFTLANHSATPLIMNEPPRFSDYVFSNWTPSRIYDPQQNAVIQLATDSKLEGGTYYGIFSIHLDPEITIQKRQQLPFPQFEDGRSHSISTTLPFTMDTANSMYYFVDSLGGAVSRLMVGQEKARHILSAKIDPKEVSEGLKEWPTFGEDTIKKTVGNGPSAGIYITSIKLTRDGFLWLMNSQPFRLTKVNTETGDREIVADNQPEKGPYCLGHDFDIDEKRQLARVACGDLGILDIDLRTGYRAFLTPSRFLQ